jgi:hypothetical protein
MNEQELNWEKKDRIGLVELTDKLKELTNEVVKKEVFDIARKFAVLQRMGIISGDNEKLKEINEKLKNLKVSMHK